jgi:hypothetical protein
MPYRPPGRWLTRCRATRPESARRVSASGIPARLAAAYGSMSGPGCRPSRANSRRGAGASARYDQPNTARIWVTTSPPSSASSAVAGSRSSSASPASDTSGCTAARAATTARASGIRSQRATSPAAAAGSAATRPAPSRRASRSSASPGSSTPSGTGRPPSVAISPVSWWRLVTMTRPVPPPGSSGRTWSASRALSSRISIRRPASRLRNSAVRLAVPAGRAVRSTPSAVRKSASTSAGSLGSPGPKPFRFTYSCPSGY